MKENLKSKKATLEKVIISVAWPYANGDLHLGHPAGYLLPASVLNDFLRLSGRDVIMVSGSDMHGTPIAVKAWKLKQEPQELATAQHLNHLKVMKLLKLKYSLYTSTQTKLHSEITQTIFIKLLENGYIFKEKTNQYWSNIEKKFLLDRFIEGECPHCHYALARGDQCDNCGRTLTPEELINPHSIFGDKELTLKSSTNYYLDLTKLQSLLKAHYKDIPEMGWRKHVVATTQSWLDEGLEPRAITRDMEGYGVSLPIGYEIPGEAGKVIYVWFEAVIGYLSASVELSLRSGHENNILAGKVLNYNLESTAIISDTYKGQSLNWEEYWFSPTTKSYYFMGKDNIPFHSIIWTAMLLGLNLNLNTPGNVVANQYLNLKGAKFSKSTGNNIDTVKFWEKFGETSSRYYLLSRSPENKDYDFTFSEFVAATNNELGANVGNLVNRTLVFWNKQFASSTHADVVTSPAISEKIKLTYEIVEKLLLECNFVEALKEILEFSSFGNRVFNDSQIWQVIKTDEQKAFQSMFDLLQIIANLARLLLPFLPEFSEQIHSYLSLTLPVNEVGSNNWLPLTYLVSKLGLILNVQPLIKKLELSDEN